MKKYTILVLLFIVTAKIFAQVGINTTTPQGILEVKSDNMGIVLPKVATLGTTSYSISEPTSALEQVTETPQGAPGPITYYRFATPAPAGTLVYDSIKHCAKDSKLLTKWRNCIVDKQNLDDQIKTIIKGGSNFKAKLFSTYLYHSLAIGTDDFVYSAGYAPVYASGNGDYYNMYWLDGVGAFQLVLNKPAVDIATGLYTSFAVLTDGSVYTWGNNLGASNGQGNENSNTETPKILSSFPAGVKALAVDAAYYTSFIVGNDGKLYTMGLNDGYYRTGLGLNSVNTKVPTALTFPAGTGNITKVSASTVGGAALDDLGNVYTWGYNVYNSCGFTTAASAAVQTPAKITLPLGAKASMVRKTNLAGLAVSQDKTKLYAWGSKHSFNSGNLGDVYTTPTDITQLLVDKGFDVAGGEYIVNVDMVDLDYSSVIVITNKRIYAAGSNDWGKLGTGNNLGGTIAKDRDLNGFQLINTSGIYPGTQFTGVSMGHNQTLFSTGVNTDSNYTDQNYVGYGSGYGAFKTLGNTTATFHIPTLIRK